VNRLRGGGTIERMKKYALFLAASTLISAPMTKPRYVNGNHLLRPEGYRQWQFVAANYGMGYTEGEPKTPAKPGTFHNIYIQPTAFEQYKKTGSFPNGTMLVMEVYKPGTNASINKQGMFQDQYVGIEVALKDESKFPEKWAYFKLFEGDKQLESAKPYPKSACWSCHNEHGSVDNVFVQFYPVLRETKK